MHKTEGHEKEKSSMRSHTVPLKICASVSQSNMSSFENRIGHINSTEYRHDETNLTFAS